MPDRERKRVPDHGSNALKGSLHTDLSQSGLRLSQHFLFFFQDGCRFIQSLTLGLHDAVDASIRLHRSHPHAQRLGCCGNATNHLRHKLRLIAELVDPLENLVADVVLVKVHQLLQEGGVTCMHNSSRK